MKFEFIERYRGVDIKRNVHTGSYYLRSPKNNTTRIFKTLGEARFYLECYEVLESHAEAMN